MFFDRAASEDVTGFAGSILSSMFLRFIGKISLGVRVCHGFIMYTSHWLYRPLGVSYPGAGYQSAILLTGLSLIVAALFWHLIERPMIGFKKFFSYHQPTQS